MKIRMFGHRMLDFVNSIDIVDHETFHDLMGLVDSYVKNHLYVTYFAILEECFVDEGVGLRTLYSTRDDKPSYTVDKEGGYASHSAYTFRENKPIWVVSGSKAPLREAADYKDMWSGSNDLPAYGARHEEICTSVMHPLRKESRPIGVLEFAAKSYIEPTPTSLEEVRTLALVIERAYKMWDVGRDQRATTKSALESLKQALENEHWTRLALPRIFVAYPGMERLKDEARAAHTAVIDTIREVVSGFIGCVEPDYWEDITEAGNINAQVIEKICSSDFGLCYFSEPVNGGESHFADNPNVLFEAGMMQALNNSPGARLGGWIPVRENASAGVPFDIAAERIVIVPRAEDNSLDKVEFSKRLRLHVENLVDDQKRK